MRNEMGGERNTGRREQIPFQSAPQPSPVLVCSSWCPNAAGTNPAGTRMDKEMAGTHYMQ